jgi:hypothetical protein
VALLLRDRQDRNKPDNSAPREVIDKAWRRYVVQKDGRVDIRAYTFCVLSHLQTAIHRRDVFTRPTWRYTDPRGPICCPMPSGKRHARSSAARSDWRPIRNRF